MPGHRILLIDNYDSFTYNLEHYLHLAGALVDTVLCDDPLIPRLETTRYHSVVISPGPGRPNSSGNLMNAVEFLSKRADISVLGICLGMQALGEFLGCALIRAPLPVHGKTSLIEHDGLGVFKNLDSPLEVMRYHSLILDQCDSKILKISAWTLEGQLPMGLRCRHLPWEGLQFHPESIGTPQGLIMIQNWIKSRQF